MRRSGRYKRKTGTAGLINEYGEDMQPGDIVHSARTTAPVGYLIANGAAVSRATYGNLFAALGTAYGAGDGATTFNLPDLRGEFIRGADQGRGVDAGRAIGSSQGDAIRNIAGVLGFNAGRPATGVSGAIASDSSLSNGLTMGGSTSGGGTGFSFDASRVVPTAAENRPRNVALLPLIKY